MAAGAVNFFLVTLMMAAAVVSGSGGGKVIKAPAPAPSVDCMEVLLDGMFNCLGYILAGSDETKPDPGCCPGLKTVMGTHPECLCAAIKYGPSYNFNIDIKRAFALPGVCHISAPPLSSTCNVSSSAPAPAPAPALAAAAPANPPPANPPPPTVAPPPESPAVPVPPVAVTPAPATNGGEPVSQAPAPSPVHAGAFAVTAYSSAALHFVMATVSFFYLSLSIN